MVTRSVAHSSVLWFVIGFLCGAVLFGGLAWWLIETGTPTNHYIDTPYGH